MKKTLVITAVAVGCLLLGAAHLDVPRHGFTGLKTRLETDDVDATVRFYADVLGLEVVERWADGEDAGVIFALGGKDGSAFLEFGRVASPREVAVSVQLRTEDLGAFLARMEGRWSVDGPHERPWGSVYAYLTDPNGIEVIVYEGEV